MTHLRAVPPQEKSPSVGAGELTEDHVLDSLFITPDDGVASKYRCLTVIDGDKPLNLDLDEDVDSLSLDAVAIWLEEVRDKRSQFLHHFDMALMAGEQRMHRGLAAGEKVKVVSSDAFGFYDVTYKKQSVESIVRTRVKK